MAACFPSSCRGRLVGVVALALVGTGCGTVVLGQSHGTHPAATARGPRTPASNRRAAERDAQRLLALVPPPPGAVRMATEPRGDRRLLNKPPQSLTGELIDRHIWWRTPASFSSVIAYLETHDPRTMRGAGHGEMGGPGIPRNRSLTFTVQPVRGVIATRELDFWVAALSGGGTAVRLDAQDVWIVPRPASERIPASAEEVDVTSARPHERPIVTVHVTALGMVRDIVALVDSMEIAQPGVVFSCPRLGVGQPVVTFDFRARVGGPLLAQASTSDYGFPSGPCSPVRLTIRGHRGPPLLGGQFLARVQRLLRVNFR